MGLMDQLFEGIKWVMVISAFFGWILLILRWLAKGKRDDES